MATYSGTWHETESVVSPTYENVGRTTTVVLNFSYAETETTSALAGNILASTSS